MEESEQPRRLRVTDALFIPAATPEGRFSITVYGDEFADRATPLLAMLGEQVVAGIVIDADGRSFAGTLDRPPQSGDRLFVGYADEALRPTEVVYRDAGQGPLVS
jgi:hypothetical protein